MIVGIIIYIVLQFGIGVWVSRRVKNEADYLLAGRNLGLLLASFSIFATWFGAETVVGAAGAVYTNGLAGCSADPFGYVLVIFIIGFIYARPLWRGGYTTFADFFRTRFSPTVERVAILLMVPSSIIWSAAQIRAFGQVVSATTGLDVNLAIVAATIVIIGYTAVGGMLADAWTDVIQGVVLILGLIVIAVALLWQVPTGTLSASMTPDRLRLFDSSEESLVMLAEAWLVPVLGSLFAIELISRVLACRSAEVARRACWLGGGIYLTLGMIPVIIGLIGPTLRPDLAEPEQLIPELARAHLSPLLYVLFSGALISAILSTVDSALLASSALVSHNLLRPALPRMSDRHQVQVARLCVAAFGLIAFVLAIQSETIERLIALSSAFGGAGLAVVAMFGLHTKRGGSLSALATLASGLLVWSVAHWQDWSAPFVTSLPIVVVVYWLVSSMEDATNPTDPTDVRPI